MKTAVLDYDAGNLRSVESALRKSGADYYIVRKPEELASADNLIFPGVGEAKASMDVLLSRGLDEAIAQFAASGKPLLGICIGCQVALEYSEESDTKCLGIMPGKVFRFPDKKDFKVPHMGWNTVSHNGKGVFKGIADGSSFYFVHSYYPQVAQPQYALGETDYIVRFTCAFGRDNMVFTQFHPEKSGPNGLKFLSNFLALAKEGRIC
jgi:glutamine amidotransferase